MIQTRFNIGLLPFVLAVVLALAVGCSNPTTASDGVEDSGSSFARRPPSPGAGTLEVFLTDWPLGGREVTALWIELQRLELHGEQSGWHTLAPAQKQFDLLQLVDDISRVGVYDLPPDHYTQIRLVLGTDNRIVFGDDAPLPLSLPGGRQTGLKIVGGFDLAAGSAARIVLDFDAQQSVKHRGGKSNKKDRYFLSPTIRIKEIILDSIVAPTPARTRLVVDTYSPNGSFTADTYIDLFGAGGDPDADDPWTGDDTGEAIAWADDGNPDFATMARIDYVDPQGLPSGTYYIRVRGALPAVDDFYAIRVLSLPEGQALPAYDFTLPLATRPDAVDAVAPGDDQPTSGGVPASPVLISLGVPLSRSLDYSEGTADVDWFRLDLP